MRTVFANILAIFRRELSSYFTSPLAYAIAGVFWLVSGWFFMTILTSLIGNAAIIDAQVGAGAPLPSIDIPYELVSTVLNVMGSLALFILPMLSMGLYAEERKRGTLELLATSPLTNWSVAVGKLLGVLTFFITMSLPVLAYEAIALSNVDPAVQPSVLLVGHGGLILLAAAVLSLGMFMSSLTDSTILAAIFTFAVITALWVMDLIAKNFTGGLADAIGHLSLLKHYTNLVQGVVDTSSLVVLGSYVLLGIFLTAQSIDALRFQRS